jgi:hypothetical protein
MGTWLDFLQIALALGVGWMGWMLMTMARAAGHGRRSGAQRETRAWAWPTQPERSAPVMHPQAMDGER